MQMCLSNMVMSIPRMSRVAFMACGIVVTLIGCSMAGQGQWMQGPAVSLPATATEVKPLQLVIDNNGGQIIYSLACASMGKYGQTTISATTSPNSPETVVATVPAGECLESGREISAGTLLTLSNFKTDDQVTVSLDVQPVDTPAGADKLKGTQLYEVGTDGLLRSGLNSVWWQP